MSPQSAIDLLSEANRVNFVEFLVPCQLSEYRIFGRSLTADARLFEIEVALDTTHHLRADRPLVSQGHDGLPFRRKQLAAPIPPGCGALRVFLGDAAGFEAGRVAPDAILVYLTHLLLAAQRNPLVVGAQFLHLAE